MRPRANLGDRSQKAASRNIKADGPNWVLIAGGALLSTLSIRIGYKLKLAFAPKQTDDTARQGSRNSKERRMGTGTSHSDMYNNLRPEDENCCNCITGGEGQVMMKNPSNYGQILTEPEPSSLSLVTVPVPQYTANNNRENGVVWVSSPERIELLPPKPSHHHHTNCSNSPCASDSGSDIFTKREVIHRLRQQLKRRDDMILEMQDQITELQSVISSQMTHNSHLQSQLDVTNKELFETEREVQRLRKAIADPQVGGTAGAAESNEQSKSEGGRTGGGAINNGFVTNGYLNGEYRVTDNSYKYSSNGEVERVDMLKREIGELREVIEGKEFLLQSYKEQKSELSIKITELQHKLDSQLPNIL